MKDLIYTGVFLGTVIPGTLERQITCQHVTHMFRPKPERVNPAFFGKLVFIKVIGYANDGDNQGYLVSLETSDEDLKKELDAIKVPHITISVSKNGKPVNTGKLNFTPIDGELLVGTYGGYYSDGMVYTRAEA